MRRTHHAKGREAIPRAFRGEDKKKSAGGGTPIVIIAALLGAVYYVTRTHPTQHAAAHEGEIMKLIDAQNRTIAALRGAAARAVAERAAVGGIMGHARQNRSSAGLDSRTWHFSYFFYS